MSQERPAGSQHLAFTGLLDTGGVLQLEELLKLQSHARIPVYPVYLWDPALLESKDGWGGFCCLLLSALPLSSD